MIGAKGMRPEPCPSQSDLHGDLTLRVSVEHLKFLEELESLGQQEAAHGFSVEKRFKEISRAKLYQFRRLLLFMAFRV